MQTDYLFVYGTLRKHNSKSLFNLIESCCVFETEGYFKGKLYDIGSYVGAVISPDTQSKVYGELYKISNTEKVFRILDAFEGCSEQFAKPKEYVRKKIPVIINDGNPISSWAYLYNRDISKLRLIPSGDYLEHLQANY